MKQIKVEQVHSKKIEYEKNGEQRSFMKYAAKSGDVWYEIKGKGKENIKQGDILIGEYITQDWESNGKTGTNHILTLVEPLIADLITRIERLEAFVYTKKLTNKQEDEINNIEDNSDLPF